MKSLKKVHVLALSGLSLLALLVAMQASAFTDEERIRWKNKKAEEQAQKLLEACREDPELEGCEALELEDEGNGEGSDDGQDEEKKEALPDPNAPV